MPRERQRSATAAAGSNVAAGTGEVGRASGGDGAAPLLLELHGSGLMATLIRNGAGRIAP